MTVSDLWKEWVARVDSETQRTRLVQLYNLLSSAQKTATVNSMKTDILAVLNPQDVALDALITDVNATVA